MLALQKFCYALLLTLCFFIPAQSYAENSLNIPILCYHNLNPVKPGSMNLTPQKLESQIQYLKDSGFTIVPLKDVVAYLQGKRDALPPKPAVITLDDGWQSVHTYMLPIVKKFNIPVTLFIYPQTISEGKNSMTWAQLKELQETGLFDIQSHTYSHPNFKQEKKRRSAESYHKYVEMELTKAKKILEEKTGTTITLLAWPFGIYNEGLEQAAANAGYEMAFSIDDHTANKSYKPMAQPRFMIVDGLTMKSFVAKVNMGNREAHIAKK
jgi:peptidoglycan/xylan/chitin deacetylase (PgdA/CDA1 family)